MRLQSDAEAIWRGEEQPSAGLQHAKGLEEGRSLITDVLEDVAGNDVGKTFRRDRQSLRTRTGKRNQAESLFFEPLPRED